MTDRQILTIRAAAALALVLTAVGVSYARPLSLPVRVVGRNDVAAPAFLGDQLTIRLRPAAARQATEHRIGDGRRQPLGIAALDEVARSLGGAWFEPEFRGEVAPRAGSDATDFTAFHLVHLPPGADLSAALDLFASRPEVESAEPVAVMPVTAMPNDSLWGISDWFYNPPSRHDIHAPEAWDITTGDTSIVIAIIDTGMLPYHPDIGGTIPGQTGSVWSNWAERGGVPGVDDDHNGFVDDTWGWDFVDLSNGSDVRAGEDGFDQEGDPNDFVGHGTNVAGIVGAIANNGSGIAGTVWNTRLMALRVGWASNRAPTGEISMAYAAQAVRYATRMGAKVVNCSFSNYPTTELELAVTEATRQGALVVIASGNNGSFNGLGDRPDVLTVGAVDRDDKVPFFSNLASWVDLVAPGTSIATTVITRPGTDSLGLRQPGYIASAAGTSFATPFAAGAAALVQAERLATGKPLLSPMALVLHLRDTADDISEQNPYIRGYGAGRLNLARAVSEPPRSRVNPMPGKQVGPLVVLPRDAASDLVALVTSNAVLLLLDKDTGDTVRVVPLPAAPASGLAAADMGGSFGTAMFVGLVNGQVAGFRPWGDPLPGWPVAAGGLPGTDPAWTGGVALGDLDADGIMEVVAARPISLRAWHVDGSLLISKDRADRIRGSVALADVDGRPGAEILFVTVSGYTNVMRADGNSPPGWPARPLSLAIYSPAAPLVTRFGQDTEPTVIVAEPVHLNALRPDGSTRFSVPLWDWPVLDPALADVNGDGSDEVIVTGGPYMAAFDSLGHKVWSATDPQFASWTSSAPVVGYLRGEREPAVVFWSGTELTALTITGSATPGFPKPGGGGDSPTIVTRRGGAATALLAGAGSDSLFYMYDLGAGSWSPEPHPWPTARGNYARTGTHLPAPILPPSDGTPPLAVTDLTASASTAGVELTWSAPSDTGQPPQASSYELRWSTVPLDGSNFTSGTLVIGTPAPGAAGTPEHMLVAGMTEGRAYYFGLRSRDAAWNVSAVSNVVYIPVPGYPPSPVTDLLGAWDRETGITLRWTATGDDSMVGKPERYQIRAADHPFDASGFGSAPIQRVVVAAHPAGDQERFDIQDLPLRGFLWLAIKAEDDIGLASEMSNLVKLEAPVARPTTVDGLAAEGVGDTSASLRWTATGDDGPNGRPVLYHVRGATSPIDDASFKTAPFALDVPATIDAGGVERCVLTGLPRTKRLWFAVQAVGSTGLESLISNVATARTGVGGPLGGRVGAGLAAQRQPSRPPVQLYWQSDEAREEAPHVIAVFDVSGRCVRKLPAGSGVGGVVSWDGRDEHGSRLGAGLYFARLSDGVARTDARIMLLP